MRKTIFTMALVACITLTNTSNVKAEETFFDNDEDMVVTEFEMEENSGEDETFPQEDQELMEVEDILEALANKSFSRCWDMTDTKYVKTGGIAIGNSSKTSTKNSIYAIKVTKGTETTAKLFTSGLNASSPNTSIISSDLGHANEMTYGYDSYTGNHVLFVAPLYNDNIYKINPATHVLQATYTTDKTYKRGAIAYTGSTSGNNYITRTRDTTTYHFEYISGTKFYTAKTFNVTFENTDVSSTLMQGICVYNNYLYISAKKNTDSNKNNIVYKVTTPIGSISNNATVTAERAYNLGAETTVYGGVSRQFEIESIDIVNGVCYFTANINAGSQDSGIGDFTGKFSM